VLKVKFPEEVRLCLGVVHTILEDEATRVSRRAEAYDYFVKVILSLRDWERKVQEEIQCVCNIGKKYPWFDDRRVKGELYFGDSPKKLKYIGKVTAKNLADMDITTVKQVAEIEDLTSVKGISAEKLAEAQAMARTATRAAPEVRDYRKFANPYKEKYGDRWEEEIAKCATLKKYRCITDLVTHIYEESKKLFADTMFKDNWYFYHDALSLMTSKCTLEWMESKGYLKHWLLPKFDLNGDTRYAGRPIGNSPEMMPMDCHLNKDLDNAVRRHIAVTHSLPMSDQRKFSMATPLVGARSYKKVWNSPQTKDASGNLVEGGAPGEDRIKTDVLKFADNCMAIYEAGGAVVHGCGNRKALVARKGHRGEGNMTGGWGGARVAGSQELSDHWFHHDALAARQESSSESLRWHNNEPVARVPQEAPEEVEEDQEVIEETFVEEDDTT